VALQSAANAVVITDRNGVIQSINPAFSQITGYTPDEVIGKHPNLLKSGKHDETFYRQLWETIMNDQAWHGELVNRRKDGSLYTEEQTITPVRNASGQVTHFIGIKQDITQRKQLEDMRDDLMKSLVHDLRNPLNSILLSLEMFQMLPENTAVPAPVRTMLGLARNATWRMMGMVNAIMDMSRLESGQLLLDRQPVILVEMVEQAINQQASLATHSEVLLLNAVPYDLPHAFVDAVLITRLFQNLLDNAIKFTPPGGKVEVKAVYDQDGDMLLVSVQDTGAGIPQDILPRVFDKYTTGTSPRRGTGLGLAFCRLAVEAHGGKIWVESQSGEGATFLFTLPVINAFKSSVKNLSVSDSK
jgi:PAS domain S-box-containing protein